MKRESNIDYELNNYISKLNISKIENLNRQLQFSNKLYYYTDKDDEFNYLSEFTKNNSIYLNDIITNDTNDKEIKKKKIIKQKFIKNIQNINYEEKPFNYTNKITKQRISKNILKYYLNQFLEKFPKKWNQDLINKIHNLTNIPTITIYKWNWNKVKKQNKSKNKEYC